MWKSTRNRFEHTGPAMGTLARAVAETPDPERAHPALLAAFGRLRQLDSLLSSFKPDSELNRLCRSAGGRAGEDLFRVLECAQTIARDSGGAFDVTIGDRTRASTWRDVELDRRTRLVRLLKPAMQLDLGGIAKGYAADEMLRVFRAHGCPRALAAVSGDIAAGDGAWNVKLQASGQTLSVKNCGVSTSGDTERRHILDARTGQYVEGIWLVSVVAHSGMLADALATALRVLGEEEGRRLAARHKARCWFRRVG
ncbi:MAG: FAD:protein FMN transferase [Candidatus Solibacter usitatus]|nr:FAD:protein FMN transferase [Candidatus Solibacter usitatus]